MDMNLAQVYAANPSTALNATDLLYIAKLATTDSGITAANFFINPTIDARFKNLICAATAGETVTIGSATPTATAILALTSTSKGFLPPAMTQAQRDAIVAPAEGLQIYNLTAHDAEVWNGTAWAGTTSGDVESITGTSNQIARNSATGAVTLSLTNGISLGSYQATSPPADGLIVPGSVGIGTAAPIASTKLEVAGTIVSQFSYGAYFHNVFAPVATGTQQHQILLLPTFVAAAAQTISTAAGYFVSNTATSNVGTIAILAGLFVDAGTVGAGTVSAAFGGYFQTPAAGAVKAAIYTDDLTIGYSAVSPPTNGVLISGSVAIGSNAATASAILALTSTSKGFRPPAMTQAQRDLISSPVEGLQIYNLTSHDAEVWNGTVWAGATSGDVESIAGTSNQISASSATGAVTLSLANGISVGSYQATSPPTGGLILPGIVGIGTSAPTSIIKLNVFASTSNAYGIYAGGTQSATTGNILAGIITETTLSPTTGASVYAAGLSASPSIIAPGGQTIAIGAGTYVSMVSGLNVGTITTLAGVYVAAGSAGTGTITNAYGGYFTLPAAGTNKAALYADNMAIGATSASPEAASLIVAGKGYFGSASGGGVAQINSITSLSIAQLHASGYSAVGGSDANNALIRLGFATGGSAANIDFVGSGSTSTLYIDNIYDASTTAIKFRLRTGGTPVTAMIMSGSGIVSCVNGSSANGLAVTISAEFGTSAGSVGGAIKLYATAPAGNFGLIQCTDGNIHLDPSTTGSHGVWLNFYGGTGGVIFGSGAAAVVATMTSAGRLALNTNASPSNALDVTLGNAQIGFANGTTAPSNGLVVSGNVGFSTSTQINEAVSLGNSTAGTLYYSVNTADASSGGFRIYNTNSLKWTLGRVNSTNDLRLTAEGSGLVPLYIVQATGYIGIGQNTAASAIDLIAANQVLDNGTGSGMVFIGSSNVATIDFGGTLYLGGSALTASYSKVVYGALSARKENGTNANYAGYLQFATNTAGGSVAERMRITSAGNVGIGTSSPSTTSSLTIIKNNARSIFLQSTQTEVDTGPGLYGMYLLNTLNPTSGATNAAGIYISTSFIAPSAQTITTAASLLINTTASANVGTITALYGIKIGAGTSSAGTIPDSYGLYVDTPASGTNKYCALFAGEVTIGATLPARLYALTMTYTSATLNVGIFSQNIYIKEGPTLSDFIANSYYAPANPTGGQNTIHNIYSNPVYAIATGKTIGIASSYFATNNLGAHVGTITGLYGFYYDGGTAIGGGGSVTTSYGLYVNTPVAGSTKICAYFQGPIAYGTNTTGGGTALLGTNSPASTLSAPYTWITAISSDGSTVYLPAWK